MTTKAKGASLAILLATTSAGMAVETTAPPKTDQSNCVPQPDCRIDYTSLPPGRSSGMQQGMKPSDADKAEPTGR